MKTQFKKSQFFIALVVLGLAFSINLQAATPTDHGSDTTKMAKKKMDKMTKSKMDDKMGNDKMKAAEKMPKSKMKQDKMKAGKDSSKMKM